MTRRRRDLDRMVDAVLAGQPLPKGHLDEPDAAALRAAIELRAARPAADMPDEEFVTGLRKRVAQAAAEPSPPVGISRRGLLSGAAGAVAAGVIGAVAESVLGSHPSGPSGATGPMVPDNGRWVAVASAGDLADGKIQRFTTATTVGFVSAQRESLSAVSGVCTHQGCLLRLNQVAGRLDCPCHRTAFGLDGKLLFHQLAVAPAPLAEIQVRNRNGHVEAFLPKEA